MSSQRVARVAELLKEEIGKLIHDHIKDPRVGFVTVTRVDVSPDIKNARVLVSIMGSKKQKNDSMNALEHGKGFIQGELGKNLRIKYIPTLHFELDESVEASLRISKLLEKIKEEEKEE